MKLELSNEEEEEEEARLKKRRRRYVSGDVAVDLISKCEEECADSDIS